MKPPPRFAISRDSRDSRHSRDSIVDGVARVTDAELHHMRDVMRLEPGAAVTLIDETGVRYAGRIARFEAAAAVIEISATLPAAAPPAIILAAAIIKGPRMDFLVEKAAELGATQLLPLLCSRAAVRNPGAERLARWRRLAITAAKQSLAPRTMEIRTPLTVADLVRNMPKETLAVVCTPGAEALAALLRRIRPSAIMMACGPEGGFDPAETAAMRSAEFVPAALGPNRLRSETAALAALSIAAGAFDEISRGI